MMNELLVNIADALAEAVSAQTEIEIAPVGDHENPTPSAPTPSGPLRPEAKDLSFAGTQPRQTRRYDQGPENRRPRRRRRRCEAA